jgi:hypothetical protein
MDRGTPQNTSFRITAILVKIQTEHLLNGSLLEPNCLVETPLYIAESQYLFMCQDADIVLMNAITCLTTGPHLVLKIV